MTEALHEPEERARIAEAFRDYGKQVLAQEHARLTFVGRWRLGLSRSQAVEDLIETSNLVEHKLSGEDAGAYIAARRKARKIFTEYSTAYMDEEIETRKTPITRPHFHIAKAAEIFIGDLPLETPIILKLK
jgi:hypothetical protein